MEVWENRSLVEELLVAGIEDWIYAAIVYDVAYDAASTPEARRILAVGMVCEVLAEGYFVPGKYVAGIGHVPWDCKIEEALCRVVVDWHEWGDGLPTPGAIVWLDLTKKGKSVALQILERENR